MASKYGKKASDKVEKAMHERKRGTLKSGSGKKVTSKKQAIAIGLSEARSEGGKVPSKKSSKKSSAKKSSTRKSTTKKSSAKTSSTKSRKSTAKKSSSKRSTAKRSSSSKSSSKKK